MTSTPLDPDHTALLLMDYQSNIVGMAPDSEALLERAQAARDQARAAGVHIGYVRVALTPEDIAAVPDRNKSFSNPALAGRMAHDSPDTQVHPSLAPEPGDIEVRKVRVGGFSTTDLAEQLAARGVDTLILAGISTSGVVLSTLRDAADHDYRLFVLADCCADPNEEVHRVLTEQVFPRQADVIGLADLAGLFATA